MQIITDHKWKNFYYGYDVPKKVLTEYGHLDDDEKADGWFRYRRRWYHLSDFLRFQAANHEDYVFKEWDGYAGDSFFSGAVIKLAADGEQYKVGTYY